MNKLLQQQLQKHFGGMDKVPGDFMGLFSVISESYDRYEKDRQMIERSIKLSAKEMIGFKSSLKTKKEELSNDLAVDGVVNNFSSITEKIEAERQLRLSEERYRYLFYNNPLPMWIYDTGTLCFLEVNDVAIEKYGYSREEFLKLTLKDIRSQDDIEKLISSVDKRMDKEYNYSGVWKHLKKNGDALYMEITSHRLRFKEKEAVLVLANDVTEKKKVEERLERKNNELISIQNELEYRIVHDITERKRNEQELRNLNEQIKKRAEELAASNAELERFAYVASHDLQEPLRMISSFMQLLQRKYTNQLDETANQYIRYAVDGADRMKKLILDLLEYSRIGTNRDQFTDIDMEEVIGQVMQTFDGRILETGALVKVQSMPVITANRTQMIQLLQNLVGNALKYNNTPVPEVEVGCEEKNDIWQFFVKDNGIGIEQKYFDKVFAIFQRLHNKSQFSGTGIGLAICKKITEKHGGNIWIESDIGKGSSFFFTIKK